MTVDSGNYWLANIGDCGGPGGNKIGVVGFAERQIFHLFDIGSGCRTFEILEKIFHLELCLYHTGKSLLAAREYNSSSAIIVVELL